MPYLTILAVIEQGFQRQIVPSCARTYLEGTKTYLYFRKRDQYKRLIAVCYVGPFNINDQMVVDGWAMAYRKYSTDYVRAETFAKSRREGLWRGEFVEPWEWRRRK